MTFCWNVVAQKHLRQFFQVFVISSSIEESCMLSKSDLLIVQESEK